MDCCVNFSALFLLTLLCWRMCPTVCELLDDSELPETNDDLTYLSSIDQKPVFFERLPSCVTSAVRLARAYTLEGTITKILQKEMMKREADSKYFSTELDQELKSLLKIISTSRNRSDPATAPTHLIDTLRFSRRVSTLTNRVIRLVHQESTLQREGFFEKMNDQLRKFITNIGCWMTADSHNAAMLNFLRVVRTYNLSKESVANGTIANTTCETPLSARELRYIVMKSHDLNAYEDVASWTEYLLQRDLEELKASTTIFRRLHYNALFKIGKIREAIDFMEKLKENGHADASLMRNLKFYNEHLQSAQASEEEKNEDEKTFELMCGSKVLNISAQNRYCKWLSPGNGWVRFKLEVFSRNPFICRIYDVINTTDETTLRQSAVSQLLSTSRFDPEDPQRNNRVLNSFDLTGSFEAQKPINRMTKRLDWITGLLFATLSSALPLQMTTEPLGGPFTPHKEYYEDKYRRHNAAISEDVMASAVFQSSETFTATKIAFPKANVAVENVPGAVTLWFSLRRSGCPDPRSEWASCPVPSGMTWTGILRILTTGHQIRRPCSLNKDH